MSQFGEWPYREVWVVDTEFISLPGERPDPVCLVAWELRSGRRERFFKDELRNLKQPPYGIGKDSLFIAYFASAEFGCHLSLGWPMPENVLDLYVEFRNGTNGLTTPSGNTLLGALVSYGLDGITATQKDSMRNLVLRGEPWTVWEQRDILNYCESDVEATVRLFSKMRPEIDRERALLRGRYMSAVARMEWNGVPIDTNILHKLDFHWEHIQDRLIETVGSRYGIYEGRSFKMDKFIQYLISHNIPWPRLKSGNLDLTDETFKAMVQVYPEIAPLRELRVILSQMRLKELQVGEDSRNRCLISPFRSRSGRNQPSNTKFIFGPSVWYRGLIRPEPGYGIAYIDYEQQEFGIAAVLSGDGKMVEAYNSGDPYLQFAKQARAVPSDATKESHPKEREIFKACALGIQYGMGAESLAQRIRQPLIVARELLRLHRETYAKFWKWSDSVQDYAMLRGELRTVFGWTVHLGSNINPRSLRNFPMQGNGAEILRLACCFATEQGIRVCAPVHDCLLIEAPLDELDDAVARTQAVMAKASAIVLDGFALRSEAKIVRYPERYMDKRGRPMWNTIMDIVDDLENDMRGTSALDCRRILEQKFESKKRQPGTHIKAQGQLLDERYPYYQFFAQDPSFKKLLPAFLKGEDLGAGYNSSFNEFVGRFSEAMSVGNIPMMQPSGGYAAGVRMDKGEVQWGADDAAGLIGQELENYRNEKLVTNPKHEAWLEERENFVQDGLRFFGWDENQIGETPDNFVEDGFISERELVANGGE